MNTIGVNIVANKTFKSRAEELLTRKTQFIHELLTELSAAANELCAQHKSHRAKQQTIRAHNTLTQCVITGYRAGVEGAELPTSAKQIEQCEQSVSYLCIPYVTLGYQTACRQIELMLLRGHHRSQTARPQGEAIPKPPDGT